MSVQDGVERVAGRGGDRQTRNIPQLPRRRGINSNPIIEDGHKELRCDGSVGHRGAARSEIVVRMAVFAHKYVIVWARKVMKLSV
jgi:hypothetical protein